MKRIRIKTVLLSVFIPVAAILLLFICLLWSVIRPRCQCEAAYDKAYSFWIGRYVPAAELGIGLFTRACLKNVNTPVAAADTILFASTFIKVNAHISALGAAAKRRRLASRAKSLAAVHSSIF